MLNDRHNIIDSIHRHIKNGGGEYSDWYVGTCGADEDSVRGQSGVDSESVIFRKAHCTEDAKAVMAYFVYIYQTRRGETLGSEDERTAVYAYKKPT
jgi:hypothetical protein